MAEEGGGVAFAVLFFDGEKEMDIGTVQVNPAMEYKPFQLMLSLKIGISPNQISIYLVDRKKIPTLPFSANRRRIPITGKVNFRLICRQKDCCFLVVLKRSRKSRSRRERIISNYVDFSDFVAEQNEFSTPKASPVPGNLVLLRRNQTASFYDQITQPELADLNNRLQRLSIQRENYQSAIGKGEVNSSPSLNAQWNMDCFRGGDYSAVFSTMMMMPMKIDSNETFCEECASASENGSTSSFHPCVRDAVVTRFTSRLGPINRPNKHLP